MKVRGYTETWIMNDNIGDVNLPSERITENREHSRIISIKRDRIRQSMSNRVCRERLQMPRDVNELSSRVWVVNLTIFNCPT